MQRINLLFLFLFSYSAFAIQPDLKTLPIGLSPQEKLQVQFAPLLADAPGPAPAGVAHSLGEWEEAREIMTLWSNPSYVRALTENGKVRLLADTESDKTWWRDWLRSNNIAATGVDYFVVPTNSIWVRDYGPWYIIDGRGEFGLIDNKYNRPRPQDDVVPDFIARTLNLPIYHTGLTHTGGNYYSDGVGNAFSSTLVFTENPNLSQAQVLTRALDFLGINNYVTAPLSPRITIEHMDTFGKLVAPDTWVFSQFPSNTQHYKYSEDMVKTLQAMKSPYGTPYKIFRMPMTARPNSSSGDFRAYINSFISNGVLYFPTYGDSYDAQAKAIYQAALPGYKIVGVENGNTEWGDSVHCRSRNLIEWNTVFVFPRVKKENGKITVTAEVYSPKGAQTGAVTLYWKTEGHRFQAMGMQPAGQFGYQAEFTPQESDGKVSVYVQAEDSMGHVKTAPIRAPAMTIDLE